MKYVASRDCTDFGGRFFRRGQVVELNGNAKHSRYLEKIAAEKPVEKPVEPEKPDKPEKPVEPE